MAVAPRTHHAEAWHTPKGRAIREVIFGMNDGLVTTIGFLAGVTISISEMRFVLLAGIAESKNPIDNGQSLEVRPRDDFSWGSGLRGGFWDRLAH